MQQTSSRRSTTYGRPAVAPGSAPVQGPGRQSAPPSARPATPASATPAPRRRDPLWARLLVALGAVLMLAAGGSIIGVKVLVGQASSGITQDDLLRGAAGGRVSIEGPLNILLVGIDERPDNNEPIRSDSIIIAHINAAHDQAYLVSIPRDLAVEIPPYPRTGYRGGREKINAAFAFGSQGKGGRDGGFELLALTIQKNVAPGIKFTGGAIVDFGGFQALVNSLGGVNMCIDQRVTSHHIGTDRNGKFLAPSKGGKPVVYEPGCRRLAPWQALDYARQRYGLQNGDYDRQRHQQQFLKAMLKEAKKQGVTANPVKALRMMEAAGKAFTVDRQGVPLEDWLYTMRNVINNDPLMLKTNGGQANSVKLNAEDAEQLTPESVQMFRAMRDDTLDRFVADHPTFVSSDGSIG
ncbi:LCP family protein [Planosporangium mesophilum]|uniref:Transcriptional regulator n=1 Tax=Planosporangium mesophilum TaxID=689768 RepID=A0A8J3X2Y8_9ACTN|nr:LCP family protein [Planosporangium mesophilum]NJC82339.1 LytR family transcriptional regulator [Planosporangium mesophilum]GII24919.1 transcriptional regulator [Planosporangium mesophilum]